MTVTASRQSSYIIPMVIMGILFFIFGFVTWVNGTLISYLKIACQLETDVQSFLVATAFFIAYGVMGIPSSLVLRKTGYKKGMALGLFVMSIGAFLFIPAANARSYNLFLTGLFIIGTGLALLQTASNPYASMIGPIESAAKRISIMGISNKFAGILAGVIFGYITLSDADGIIVSLKTMNDADKITTLSELAGRVVVPYIIIGSVLVIVAIAILFSTLPDVKEEGGSDKAASQSGKTSIFQFPHLLLGALAIFLYVGVEVMAGDTIINYGKSLGIEFSRARFFSSWTLGGMLVGYVVGIIAIPKYISQSFALRICAILGVVFTILAVATSGETSVVFIALLGLANSLMWPAIFPLGVDGLGKFTKAGSGLLVSAIAGGGVLPLIYGGLLQVWNPKDAYLMMVPCYLYILYFATSGYKAGRATN